MKQKRMLIIITCLLSASLVLALGTVTFSWYQAKISTDKEIVIPADGFLIVGFDEKPLVVDHILTPAIAMPNAIRDNKYIDVKRVYKESDSPISYVSKVAQTYTYTDKISFYQDPDADENATYDFVLTAQAYVKLGDDETIHHINTDREIIFDITADIDYTDAKHADVTDIAITPEATFNILGSATITVQIEICLAQPDELCDPSLISNKLYFEFGVLVDTSTTQNN